MFFLLWNCLQMWIPKLYVEIQLLPTSNNTLAGTIWTAATGWSMATVYYDFYLTGVKKQKNGKTQPFLLSWHMDILIFWCPSEVRWEKMGLSGLFQNIVTAPYCKDWEPRYPKNTSEHLSFQNYHLDNPKYPPQHPPYTPKRSPENTRHQQTTTDANRHKETASDTPRHWHLLFDCVWRCLLASVVVC